jgi:hypothetical protein
MDISRCIMVKMAKKTIKYNERLANESNIATNK